MAIKTSGLAGLFVILAKLGPKIVSITIKAIKAVAGIKSLGAVASVGLYTYLLTWQMGVALVVFLLVHEYGHLYAMKQCGLKTRGVYLIPGFGAVAISSEKFGGARNEAFIAMMGPIIGLVGFVLPVVSLYFITGNPLWASIAGLMTFINLFNLFPVNPLDGGRITKALVYSYKQSWGFSIMFALFLATAGLGFATGLSLILLISIIGLYEIVVDYGLKDKLNIFIKTCLRLLGVHFLFIALSPLGGSVELNSLGGSVKEVVGWGGVLFLILYIVLVLCILFLYAVDMVRTAKRYGKKIYWYPVLATVEAFEGIVSLLRLTHKDLESMPDYPQMNRLQLRNCSMWYILLVTAHVGTIIYLAGIPGSELAMELLK